MALTISLNAPDALFSAIAVSGQIVKTAILVGDAAYATGGYAVTPGTFGFGQQIVAISVYPYGMNASAYVPVYDPVFKTVRVLQLPSTPSGFITEVATGTNLTGAQMAVAVWGL